MSKYSQNVLKYSKNSKLKHSQITKYLRFSKFALSGFIKDMHTIQTSQGQTKHCVHACTWSSSWWCK